MVYRQFAPVAPQTTINFGMTMAFPSCNITGAGRTHRSRRISYVDHIGPFLPQYSRVVRIVQALSLTSSIAGSMFCLIPSCASCEFLARRSYPSPSTLPTLCSRALGSSSRRGATPQLSSLESHNPEVFSSCSSPFAKNRPSVLPLSNPSWIISNHSFCAIWSRGDSPRGS
jgi:hypothetical protein